MHNDPIDFGHYFGMLLRALVILAIGIGAWVWFDPKPLWNVPLFQLTLGMIMSNVLAGTSTIGCVFWFFHFPKHDDGVDSPYESWITLGMFILIAIAIFIYIRSRVQP